MAAARDIPLPAKLTAAAPDLLAACKESLRLMDGEDWLFDLGELGEAFKRVESQLQAAQDEIARLKCES